MKVTNEKTENSQAFLTIEMESNETEESLEKAYNRLVRKTNIPGFRKGKAPRDILERYIGKEAILEDALQHMIPHAYEKAISEQKIEPIARPYIEVAQTDPVIFKATVPLPPTIELGDYHSIRVKQEPIELTDDNINAVIEQLRHRHATWEPVERPVELGDLITLDVNSTIDDAPFMKQDSIQYHVSSELPFPAPGFAEQVAGMNKNEEKEFTLQLPSDYPRSELAGKEPSFKVKVTEIKQEKLPELNDEFAQGISPDFKTMESLREQVSTDLRLSVDEKAKVDFEERVIEAVVELTKIEFPPIMVEAETNALINQRLHRGNQSLEEYLKNINKTEEELREELKPLATKRVTRSLVLGRVAETEKIEVSDNEIDAEIEEMLKSATEKPEELRKLFNTQDSRESIERILITRKTLQRLVEIAKEPEESTEKQKEEEK